MSREKLKVIMNEEIAFVKTKMYERIKNKLELVCFSLCRKQPPHTIKS